MALPDFGVAEQMALRNARILIVGAGGLGAAALPYLAGAGIGHITICDDDMVSSTAKRYTKTRRTGRARRNSPPPMRRALTLISK